jgi:hypothetical protein
MENIFNISIRLTSDDFDFISFNEHFSDYKTVCHKKGESIVLENPNSNFRSKKNIFIVEDIYQINKIDYDFDFQTIVLIFERINTIITKCSGNIRKEVYIQCHANNQQFGIDISNNFINKLSEHNYSIVLSGIVLLGDD